MKKFMIKGAIWIAIIVFLVFGVLAFFFGKVIEETLLAEVIKWVLVALFVILILEVIWYTVGKVLFHAIHDGKE